MGGWKWPWLGYLMAAGGYGGWRATDLWSDWGIWALGLLPVLVVVPLATYAMMRTGATSLVEMTLLVSFLGSAFIGACAVGLAAAVAHTTRDWADPGVRAGVGMAGAALVGGLILATRRPRPAPEPAEAPDPAADDGRA